MIWSQPIRMALEWAECYVETKEQRGIWRWYSQVLGNCYLYGYTPLLVKRQQYIGQYCKYTKYCNYSTSALNTTILHIPQKCNRFIDLYSNTKKVVMHVDISYFHSCILPYYYKEVCLESLSIAVWLLLM